MTKHSPMSLTTIHLRKLLKLFYLTPNRLISDVRAEIRQDIAREEGLQSGGGDFHAPFWSDARSHTLGIADLYQSVEMRVQSNPGRERLYPRLRDGFLLWWNERRRWTNGPFAAIESPHTRIQLDHNLTIKLEGILALRDARGRDHYVYPYFSEAPVLRDEAARVGLWILMRAFPQIDPFELRILDVLRGITYSIDKVPLIGNEESIFFEKFLMISQLYMELRKEYIR